MLDRRIALDARDELGPALLLHLHGAQMAGLVQLGTVLTRDWDAKEAWRLSTGGGGRVKVTRVDDGLLVDGHRCAGVAQVVLGGTGEGPESWPAAFAEGAIEVLADARGALASPARPIAPGQSRYGVACGHALALADAIGVLAARLELRWALIELEIADRQGGGVDLDLLERSLAQDLPTLAGKLSLRLSHSTSGHDRIRVNANLGGAPGAVGVREALGDALFSAKYRDRVLEAQGALKLAQLCGLGRVALLTAQTHAMGSLATFVFDYDARDLQAARMVQLALAVMEQSGADRGAQA